MTPVPIELPVRAGEAGALADVVFQHAEGRKLNESMRSRIGARVAALQLSLTVFPGSLQRDPIHPTAFYVVADEVLLRIGLESTPSSGLFPNALLIGRIRTGQGREVLVSATPFGHADHVNIRKFADHVDREFLPVRGANLPEIRATVSNAGDVWHRAIWHAIRAGWRQGWTATLIIDSLDEAVRAAKYARDFTRFSVRENADRIYRAIHDARAGKQFELEIDLTGSGTETTPAQITEAFISLREAGKPVTYIAPRILSEPHDDFASRLAKLHEAAKHFGATLSLPNDPAIVAVVGKVTGSRVHYRVRREPDEIARPAEAFRP